MPLATTLRSIVEANRSSQPLEVYVLWHGLSETARGKICDSLPRGSASIRWLAVDLTPFRNLSTSPYISKMTYARLLIPNMLTDSVSKVLYLDTDVLVCDDLGPLWETDLEGAVVGAILDGLDQQIKGGKPGVESVPRVRDYFNAGVLLIDLDRWRTEGISEKALEYLGKHPRSPFSDQDALNVACDGHWKQLDPRWNFQCHHKTELSATGPEQRPGIVHFVTSLKPWDASALSMNATFYDGFRCRTCFARTTQERIRDVFLGVWAHSKGMCKRHPFVRRAWTDIMQFWRASS
jgi:lipopolysaccharide biosynthesis glycosyltransferase